MPKQSAESYVKMASTMAENKAVEQYLQWITNGTLPLKANQTEAITRLDARIKDEPRLHMKVRLIAERHRMANPAIDKEALVEDFVKHAGSFSERNGVTYAVWREMGVPVAVLTQAGLAPVKSEAPAPRDPAKPKQIRHRMTQDFIDGFVATYDEEGPEVAAARYGYQPAYAKSLRQRIARGEVVARA